MSKVQQAYFDLIQKHEQREQRKKRFLRWIGRVNRDLYYAIINGEVRFKDKWLSPVPKQIKDPWAGKDVPF